MGLKTKSTGMIIQLSQGSVSDAPDSLQKNSILVHVGEFESKNGPVVFDETKIRAMVMSHNAHIRNLGKDYGGVDKIPLGAFPPFQEDHEETGIHTIGRVNGLLSFEFCDVPGVGVNVPAALGPVRIIGKENTRRVLDGRIYHVSIGYNPETNRLDELSSTPFPAATGAMLLSKGKAPAKIAVKGDKTMPQRLQARKQNLSKLSALRNDIEKLSTNLVKSSDNVKLARKRSSIIQRLSSAMSSGKLTPAEFKCVKLDDLVTLDDKALNISLSMFDARQPVIEPGQRGSTSAVEAGQMANQVQSRMVKDEVRLDLVYGGDRKRMAKAEGKKLADVPKGNKNFSSATPAPVVPSPNRLKLSQNFNELKQCLDSGNIEAAKQCMSKLDAESEGIEMAGGPVGSANMQDPMQQIAQLEEQVANLQVMVGKLMDVVSDFEKDEALADGEGEPKPGEEGAPAPVAEGDKKEGEEKPGEKLEGEEKPGEKKEGEEKPGEKLEEKKPEGEKLEGDKDNKEKEKLADSADKKEKEEGVK